MPGAGKGKLTKEQDSLSNSFQWLLTTRTKPLSFWPLMTTQTRSQTSQALLQMLLVVLICMLA
jgi:hypothetical protein